MDKATIQRLQDAVDNNTQIGIAVGKNPTLDDMGAALGLFLSLKAVGKDVSVACPTEPIVAVSSLVGIDKVKTSLGGGGSGDLVVSFPYAEGEIEKVSYTLEDGYLNIIVKTQKGLSFSDKDVRYNHGSGKAPTLLFVVGTPNLSDLGSVFDPEATKDTTLINVDSKSQNQGFGDIVLVSSQFSSTSEQIAYILEECGWPLDTDIAQNLLSGISFATNNFQDQKTSYLAFEMAGVLMQKGAVRTETQQSESREFEDIVPFLDDFNLPPVRSTQSQPSRGQQQVQEPQGVPPRDRSFRQNRPQENRGRQQNQQRGGFNQPQRQQSGQQQGQSQQQTQPSQQPKKDTTDEDADAPPDWLTPKVYKGSTLV